MVESRCRIEVILSVVCGAQDCHAAIASAAEDHGQVTLKKVALEGSGWTLKVNSVTIPKLPPPPPLSAHRRSLSVRALTVRSPPSAVTILALTRLSAVSP